MGRAPQGARGLKSHGPHPISTSKGSRPARGAWVEIFIYVYNYVARPRRAPQGARVLKSVRGLTELEGHGKSRPARGAWVEITYLSLVDVRGMSVAPRKGRVG